ncbi:hypothetical protein ACFL7M_16365 [Thermodesulfobacteriota bacterium]
MMRIGIAPGHDGFVLKVQFAALKAASYTVQATSCESGGVGKREEVLIEVSDRRT